MLRRESWPAILPLFCVSLAAQNIVPGREGPARPKETLGLVDRARGLPPEFSADILLKLARSRLIPQAKWKQELIEEAFISASRAQLPYPRIAYGLSVDSRENQEVSRNDLEALTLQTRAVDSMLDLNPQRAVTMFQDIVFPALPKVPCDDPAVPLLDKYYAIIPKLVTSGFTVRQRQKEEGLQFLEQHIASMQSPAQVPHVLRMIFAVQVSSVQRKQFLASFAVALDRVRGGDREYSTFEATLVPADVPEIAENAIFIPALRSYIVRQVSAARCSDHSEIGKLPTSVSRFNLLAAKVDPGLEGIHQSRNSSRHGSKSI